MAGNIYGTVLVPFSEYPLTRRFSDRGLPKMIFISSFLALSGLIVFNVLTQGYVKTSESLLQPHYQSSDASVTCQPATMTVGNSFFTNQPPNFDPLQRSQGDPSDPRGSFSWVIEGVVNGYYGRDTQTGFQYEESPLKCNVTSISLDFDFRLQSFSYSICVLCSTPSVDKRQKDWDDKNYVSLCTSFSLLNNVLPKFAQPLQISLQSQVFGISKFYSQLNIPQNSLPASAFPDYSSTNKTLNNPLIPSRDILAWNTWLADFNYTPPANYVPFDSKSLHFQPEPQGKLYLSPTDSTPRDFAESFVEMISKGSSGLQIAAVGVGGIRPIPINQSFANVLSAVPQPLPLYINLTQSILALMMDSAAQDINERVLGVSYLCTATKTTWKEFFPMVATIFGSCSGTFGAALTLMIFLARRYDHHVASKRNSLTEKEGDDEEGLNSKRGASLIGSSQEAENRDDLNSSETETKNVDWDFRTPV